MGAVPMPAVIRDFARYSKRLPEVDPDVIETLVDFKKSYFGDADPTRWRADVLRELMLDILPRKVTAPEDWFAAVVPTTRAYLSFLSSHRQLARGSDSAKMLLAQVDRIGDDVVAASQDPRNFGMAKAILTAIDFDPSAPDPARAMMETFNSLSDEQRAAILDPALRNLVAPGIGLAELGLPGIDPSDLGSDSFFTDIEDQSGPWEPLPPIWLPPAPELAAAVKSAPIIRSLLQLGTWTDSGRTVTQRGILTMPAARQACTDLGLSLPSKPVRDAYRIPALRRLWSLATDHKVIAINKRSAVPGPAASLLMDPGHDPEAVVDWWTQLFIDYITWDLSPADDFDVDETPDESLVEIIDNLFIVSLSELYKGADSPRTALAEAAATMVEDIWPEYGDNDDLSPEQVRSQARQSWVARVTQLVELGAAVVDDDLLRLTPLGRAGVRAFAMDNDVEAPLLDDPATLDAATLLTTLPALGESVADTMIAAWSAAHSADEAMAELLSTASTGRASARMIAISILKEYYSDYLNGEGRPYLESLRDDPTMGVYAYTLLAQPGQDSLLLPNPQQVPPHLRQWTALEAVALAIESDFLDDEAIDEDAVATVWEMFDRNSDLDSAWRSTHPQLLEVLETVAARHPRGRTRKAAKKALFKTRQRIQDE